MRRVLLVDDDLDIREPVTLCFAARCSSRCGATSLNRG
jgi:hypothetical protein